jgi:hypothetical protein
MNGNGSEIKVVVCASCEFQLARIRGEELTIRIRDQFIYAIGGAVKMICRGCGIANSWISESFKASGGDKVSAFLGQDGQLARVRDWQPRPRFDRENTKPPVSRPVKEGARKNV